MLDLLSRPVLEIKTDTPSKRELIERELLENPERSNREIARIVGCDHKTVGAARERLGEALALVASPPISPSASTEELLRRASPHIDWDSSALRESCKKVDAMQDAEAARDALGMNEQDGYSFWSVPAQTAIECRARENGSVELWQGTNEADAGDVICIAAGNAVMLARHILYAAGFVAVGIYTHTRSGNVDIADGDLAGSFYDE